jgi:hypothetical protein
LISTIIPRSLTPFLEQIVLHSLHEAAVQMVWVNLSFDDSSCGTSKFHRIGTGGVVRNFPKAEMSHFIR